MSEVGAAFADKKAQGFHRRKPARGRFIPWSRWILGKRRKGPKREKRRTRL